MAEPRRAWHARRARRRRVPAGAYGLMVPTGADAERAGGEPQRHSGVEAAGADPQSGRAAHDRTDDQEPAAGHEREWHSVAQLSEQPRRGRDERVAGATPVPAQ